VIVPRRTLLTEIDEALASGEFTPFAQPIFSLATGAVTGCEIVARWVRGDGSVIAPARFINLAEETGRIVPLTRRLMQEALSALRPLMARHATFTVAFNISSGHFLSAGFLEEVLGLVGQANVEARHVVLEITERQTLSDLTRGARLIEQLARSGFRVAIDDAGTGHNGLAYLQALGAHILKIDKFFVEAIDSEGPAWIIVEMLANAALRLGMTTIPEGIERPEQLSWLRQLGVDEGQGFIVSPALPLGDFAELVEALLVGGSGGSESGRPPVGCLTLSIRICAAIPENGSPLKRSWTDAPRRAGSLTSERVGGRAPG